MDELSSGDLTIVPSRRAGVLSLVWLGKSTDRHPERTIGGYLTRALADASQAAETIEHHFEKMTFFNSSTISTLIHHVREARAAHVKVALVYADGVQWQRVSFTALGGMVNADGLVEIRAT